MNTEQRARKWLNETGPTFSRERVKSLMSLLDKVRTEEREAAAAYCLDRADQFPTQSPIWISMADCAEDIAKGKAAEALRTGETEDLLERVRKLAGFTRKTPKPKERPCMTRSRSRGIGITEAECELEGGHDAIRCDPHCCDEIRCMYCDTVLALVTYQEMRKELAAQHESDVEYWIDKLKAWKARQPKG